MFMFGLTTTMQGLTQNYGGLIATRFFLGKLSNEAQQSVSNPECNRNVRKWHVPRMFLPSSYVCAISQSRIGLFRLLTRCDAGGINALNPKSVIHSSSRLRPWLVHLEVCVCLR